MKLSSWQAMPVGTGEVAAFREPVTCFKTEATDFHALISALLRKAEKTVFVDSNGLQQGHWRDMLLWDPLFFCVYLYEHGPISLKAVPTGSYLSLWNNAECGKKVARFVNQWLDIPPEAQSLKRWRNQLQLLIQSQLSTPASDHEAHISLLLAGLSMSMQTRAFINEFGRAFFNASYERLGLQRDSQELTHFCSTWELQTDQPVSIKAGSALDGGILDGSSVMAKTTATVELNPVSVVSTAAASWHCRDACVRRHIAIDQPYLLFSSEDDSDYYAFKVESQLLNKPGQFRRCQFVLLINTHDVDDVAIGVDELQIWLHQQHSWQPTQRVNTRCRPSWQRIVIDFDCSELIPSSQPVTIELRFTSRYNTAVHRYYIARMRLDYRVDLTSETSIENGDGRYPLHSEQPWPWLSSAPTPERHQCQLLLTPVWRDVKFDRLELAWQWQTFEPLEDYFFEYRRIVKLPEFLHLTIEDVAPVFSLSMAQSASYCQQPIDSSFMQLSLDDISVGTAPIFLTLQSPLFGLGHRYFQPLTERQLNMRQHWNQRKSWFTGFAHAMTLPSLSWGDHKAPIWHQLLGKNLRKRIDTLVSRWKSFNIDLHFPLPNPPLCLNASQHKLMARGQENLMPSEGKLNCQVLATNGDWLPVTRATWWPHKEHCGAEWIIRLHGRISSNVRDRKSVV